MNMCKLCPLIDGDVLQVVVRATTHHSGAMRCGMISAPPCRIRMGMPQRKSLPLNCGAFSYKVRFNERSDVDWSMIGPKVGDHAFRVIRCESCTTPKHCMLK